ATRIKKDVCCRLVAYIAKAFYGPEYYVVLHYVYLNTCIKEDDLRKKTTFDQRYLRRILAQLKMDKILKERCDMEGTAGRSHKFLCHRIFRRKMEIKENGIVFNAYYKCTGCEFVYGALDMDKIFDAAMGEMKCYRCQHRVIPDESTIPTEQTRSLLARFNEQMMPLFSLLEKLDGIHLAHHLLEPSMRTVDSENPPKDENKEKTLRLGERTIGGSMQITHSAMQCSSSITVCIGNENNTFKAEGKQEVPWLHDEAKPSLTMITGIKPDQMDSGESFGDCTLTAKVDSSSKSSTETDIEDLLMEEFDEEKTSPSEIDLKKGEVEWNLNSEGSDEDGDMVVCVRGIHYQISELTPQLVLQMTELEREAYAQITREQFEF
ncbi:unnamed protein product, partial [Toxocara canis]|uniref:TFIIE domain-containing protein n=1 Tax=Toxocara canis TaxID=6265 RepID=A0A183UNS1_TOXCA